jgi:hypothetical protein
MGHCGKFGDALWAKAANLVMHYGPAADLVMQFGQLHRMKPYSKNL